MIKEDKTERMEGSRDGRTEKVWNVSASAPAADPLVGNLILGRYRVIGIIGSGGMGIVYRCHDEIGDIFVALKTLPLVIARDAAALDAMRANFRLIERLHHPNIAGIKTIEQDAETGMCYLVLELVEGLDLLTYRKTAEGLIPSSEVISMLQQVAAALDYGHSEQIIHRDIKPSNILVTPDGKVKVLDYGIASRIQESLARVSREKFDITGTGPYMAPEQWRGRRQDPATDQYALAVVSHELLSGQLPFTSKDMMLLREIVLTEEPTRPENMAPRVWDVMKKGLAKERKDRFPSCSAFVSALDRSLHPTSIRSAFRVPYVAVGLAGIATIALAWAIVHTRSAFYSNGERGQLEAGVVPMGSGTKPVEDSLRYHALVIGISDYQHDRTRGWNDLANAQADAEAIAEVLESDYSFEVTRLMDARATQKAIIFHLDRLNSLTNSAVLIYYAGHGYYDERLDEGYWIPSDAERDRDGKIPRESWIWNSVLTKLVDASIARHVLIIADACYSGSLMRGNAVLPARRELQWYRRAFQTPSRYLITSGGIEPVLDSGAGHSIFAQQVLHYLKHPTKDMFSASELGHAIRNKVSSLTLQMPLSRHLPVSSDAGGEFVFVRHDALDPVDLPRETSENPSADILQVSGSATNTFSQTRMLQDAILLSNQGATNTAKHLIESLTEQAPDSRLVQSVSSYVEGKGRREAREHIHQRIGRIQEAMQVRNPDVKEQYSEFARPRIIACLGPTSEGDRMTGDAGADLYRILLADELGTKEDLIVIERDHFDAVLQELGISISDIADAQAAVAVGKELPANMLLLGDLFQLNGKQRVSLRLVETSTSRILKTFRASSGDDEDIELQCHELANQIAEHARKYFPFQSKVMTRQGDGLRIGVGSYHGASKQTLFALVRRVSLPADGTTSYSEKTIGSATVVHLGKIVSEVHPTWLEGTGPRVLDGLWAYEVSDEP